MIPVRITDINYGGHVGNDTLLSIVHEARMQYFAQMGYSEMQFAGVGMIMADAAIEFKSELFYGDVVIASVAAGEVSKVGFDLFYKLETLRHFDKLSAQGHNMTTVTVALAKTGMICYDYEKKKMVAVPEEARLKLTLGQ